MFHSIWNDSMSSMQALSQKKQKIEEKNSGVKIFIA
jgi:hypothetical protein